MLEMKGVKKNIGISKLIKKIKKFEVKNFNDLVQLKILSEIIYGEWIVLKDKNKQSMSKRKNASQNEIQRVAEEQIAEEQIVVGLFCLLAQKVSAYTEKVTLVDC